MKLVHRTLVFLMVLSVALPAFADEDLEKLARKMDNPLSEVWMLLAQTQGEVAPNVDNACGWLDNFDVIDAIEAGVAYVNVHTLQNLAGEIRGQLE